MIFGKSRDKGLRLRGLDLEVVSLDEVSESELLVHDEAREDSTLAFLLSGLTWPAFPVPLGVLRAVQRPTYDALMSDQIDRAVAEEGPGDLGELFRAGDTWVVE